MKLTEKFEAIIKNHTYLTEGGESFHAEMAIDDLIKAVKERDTEALGPNNEFIESEHDSKHYTAVLHGFRLKHNLVKQRMEKSL